MIPIYGAHDAFVECLRSAIAHTPVETPVLLMDDASPDERSRRLVADLAADGALQHPVHYVRHADNRGFVATVNEAFALAAPADVIVLNSDCVVTEGWLPAMRSAAHDPLVATVSVLTNNGTILSLPDRNQPTAMLPQTLGVDAVARAVGVGSARMRPRIPTAIGHCFLVRRAALDLVGDFDDAFSPGYGEEVDFSQRCLRAGLVHVVADDVFVFHRGSASFDPAAAGNPLPASHHEKLIGRYGYYDEWVTHFADASTGPFAHAYRSALSELRPLSVTIDSRCLGPIVTGTQIHTLEVIAALARDGTVLLRVVVPADLGDYARMTLAQFPAVRLLSADAALAEIGRTDVVHRPMQVGSPADLELLEHLGERIVITHQDLISYENPSYFRSFADWERHRSLARTALALADRVVFFSHSAANQALAEQIVSADKLDVVYIGTDHSVDAAAAVERPPAGVDRLGDRPFLLCLGTDYAHKNRPFALRLLRALQRDHDFNGGLVFAGAHVPTGSSAAQEAECLTRHPELAGSVVDVAAVDESEKRWLLAHAALMVYPTVHEGFGLVPFEAAEAGLACAFASHTSIAELLPGRLAVIEPWDVGITAERIAALLADDTLRAEHIASVRAAGARFTWRSAAQRLLDVYRVASSEPLRESRRLARDSVAVTRRYDALLTEHLELTRQFDKDAQGLVGANGVIPPELRRPLLAIGRIPALRKVAFGILRAIYVAGYRLQHRGRAPGVI